MFQLGYKWTTGETRVVDFEDYPIYIKITSSSLTLKYSEFKFIYKKTTLKKLKTKLELQKLQQENTELKKQLADKKKQEQIKPEKPSINDIYIQLFKDYTVYKMSGVKYTNRLIKSLDNDIFTNLSDAKRCQNYNVLLNLAQYYNSLFESSDLCFGIFSIDNEMGVDEMPGKTFDAVFTSYRAAETCLNNHKDFFEKYFELF